MFSLSVLHAINARHRMRAVTHRLRVLGEDGVNAIRGHPHVRPVFTEVTRADAIAAGDVFLVPMTVSDDAGNVTCSLTPEQIAINAPIAIMLAAHGNCWIYETLALSLVKVMNQSNQQTKTKQATSNT